jgi:transposase
MSQITVLTGPERRRRWHPDDKMRILAEAFSAGACVAEVARRHDVSTGLIYSWRAKLRGELPQAAFAQAVLADEPRRPLDPSAAIVVELPGCGRVSISASASPVLASAVLKALR